MADESLVERVTRVLAEEIGPALELNGKRIEVLEVVDGIARIRLNGLCSSCPTTILTVINGIEQELRQRIPEVQSLEAVG